MQGSRSSPAVTQKEPGRVEAYTIVKGVDDEKSVNYRVFLSKVRATSDCINQANFRSMGTTSSLESKSIATKGKIIKICVCDEEISETK